MDSVRSGPFGQIFMCFWVAGQTTLFLARLGQGTTGPRGITLKALSSSMLFWMSHEGKLRTVIVCKVYKPKQCLLYHYVEYLFPFPKCV